MFGASEAVSILGFLPSFQMVSYTNGIRQGAQMIIFHVFLIITPGEYLLLLYVPVCPDRDNHFKRGNWCYTAKSSEFHLQRTHPRTSSPSRTKTGWKSSSPPVKERSNTHNHSRRDPSRADPSTTNTVSNEQSLKAEDGRANGKSEIIELITSLHRYRNSIVTLCNFGNYSQQTQRWNENSQGRKRRNQAAVMGAVSWMSSPPPPLRVRLTTSTTQH